MVGLLTLDSYITNTTKYIVIGDSIATEILAQAVSNYRKLLIYVIPIIKSYLNKNVNGTMYKDIKLCDDIFLCTKLDHYGCSYTRSILACISMLKMEHS